MPGSPGCCAADETIRAGGHGLWLLADNAREMSHGSDTYDARVDWQTAVAFGDTLAVGMDDGCDDRWIEAFQVVLHEHEHRTTAQSWSEIDFDHVAGGAELRVLVREIAPDAGAAELRQAVEEVVEAANRAARVGTHVYDLARELRRPEPEGPRESIPPPSLDPLADELDADAA